MRTVIIGGGAAGLFAALTAARRGETVTLLERNDRVGKKLLLTGSGRCNLTNLEAGDPAHYHGSVDVRPALAALGPDDLLRQMAGLGVALRADAAGRVYPRSGQAAAVLDALRFGAQAAGARIRTGARVTRLAKKGGSFRLQLQDGARLAADRVLFCVGGKSAPATGSDGDAFSLLTELGHRVTPLSPGLAPIKTDPALLRGCEGLRVLGRAAFYRDGAEIDAREGEIQLTKSGAVSGICVQDLSRYVTGTGVEELRLDLLPQHTPEAALALLAASPAPDRETRIGGLMNKRVGLMLAKAAADDRALVRRVKDWRLPVLGLGSWAEAQVTVGGVPGDELDPQTLESRVAPGLFVCGEAADVDGDCGGFNLHWAFASGALAAGGAR